jgi:predicted enzyme related to lactoylglutathione lyase
MSSHGMFTWNELASSDVERAKAFYTATLGWTFEEFELPGGPYWVVKLGDHFVAGISGLDSGSLPEAVSSYWFSFIEVDDVDARVALARAHGATLLQAPQDVPNVGRVAVLRDPTGAAIGWMTSVRPD